MPLSIQVTEPSLAAHFPRSHVTRQDNVYACVHAHTCAWAHMYVCVFMHVCMCVHTCMCVSACMCVCACASVCLHVYVCMCVVSSLAEVSSFQLQAPALHFCFRCLVGPTGPASGCICTQGTSSLPPQGTCLSVTANIGRHSSTVQRGAGSLAAALLRNSYSDSSLLL